MLVRRVSREAGHTAVGVNSTKVSQVSRIAKSGHCSNSKIMGWRIITKQKWMRNICIHCTGMFLPFKKGHNQNTVSGIAVYAILGRPIGAKLLFYITEIEGWSHGKRGKKIGVFLPIIYSN